ncbi:hypothetical protein AB0L06_43365 [Spirillospora sp. NPDC052269]
MVIQGIHTAVGLARSAIKCKASGLWQVIQAYVVGRNAVTLERERRTTLLVVASLLPPGTELLDLRADGSTLELRAPAVTRVEFLIDGNIEQSSSQNTCPSSELPSECAVRRHLSSAPAAKE